MSQRIILCDFMKRTFTKLQTNKNQIGKNCEDFSNTLNGYIDELPRKCGMKTSLDYFKQGTLSLHGCCHKVKNTTGARFADNSNDRNDLGSKGEISKPVQTKKTGVVLPESESPFSDKAKPTKQSNDSNGNERMTFSPYRAGLQEELQMIKASGEFQTAVDYFKKANESLAQIFKDKDEIKTKIKATEVRVICELLGNLTDLTDAVEKCKQYLLQLHELLNVYVRGSDLTSVMNINKVLYDFVKTFIGKPVVILDWPMIDAQGPKKLHPILENAEDPFTKITDINKKNVQIESSIAAINCSRDIFAKEKASTNIVRVTSNCNKWYSLNDDSGAKIVSIAIDCVDCETPTMSQLGEPSTQSSPRLTSLVCRGKMYILVRCEFQRSVRYFLHVIDMEGNKEHEEELGFLERFLNNSTEVPKVKIFCINEQKLVILDVTRRVIHICDHKGMEKNTIDATDYLSSVNDSRPPIFTCNGEMICLRNKYGVKSVNKINVYNIIDEKSSFLDKTGREIKVKGLAVQALTFNHKSDEITMLCYTGTWLSVLTEYHLVTYTKDGELKEDIKLSNYNKYCNAGLICNTNGPIALLDDFQLLI